MCGRLGALVAALTVMLSIPLGHLPGIAGGTASAALVDTLLVLDAEAPGDRFSFYQIPCGDVNGDGFDDVIAGSPSIGAVGVNAGRVYIFHGGPAADSVPDVILDAEAPGDLFGGSVGFAGDLNGDGYGDVVVGAPYNSAGGSSAGRAYVFFGGPGMDATADLVLTGEASGDLFGYYVGSRLGDVNDDGEADLIVGAQNNSAGGYRSGRAYVYFGGPGMDATADLVLTGSGPGDNFGRFNFYSGGDFNGDGDRDILVGAVQFDAGKAGYVHVYFGGPALDAVPDLVLVGESAGPSEMRPGDRFGDAPTSAGDVNGDGFEDILVGAFRNDAAGYDGGRSYVYFGGPGLDATADWVLTGEAAGDYFGSAVTGPGDLNGDGFDDVVVGAAGNDAGGAKAGRVYVYFGGPAPDAVPDVVLTCDLGSSYFGQSLGGGDINGDGHPDFMAGANYYDSGAGRAFVLSLTDRVSPDPGSETCISSVTPCLTVPVILDRSLSADARAVSVTFTLSPELQLCDLLDPAASVRQGPWLDGYLSHYEVLDAGGGIYTVDQSILGAPCGVSAGDTLFTVDVTRSGGDGTGTLTVTDVLLRECDNHPLPVTPGPPATFRIDFTAPAPLGDLSAAQVKSGNDGDGTTRIDLGWTASPEPDADLVEVYRKGFGFYPEYDDDGGTPPGVPADPAAALVQGWTLAATLGGGGGGAFTDEPPERDFWYYVAFVVDACGNLSGVSNRTGGTLNYHLGDVSPVSPPSDGDNRVDVLDISKLGFHYGTSEGNPQYLDSLDVGPTADTTPDGLPDTDNRIQFEDLMIFAINHGGVSKPSGSRPPAADRNALVLETPAVPGPGGTFDVVLRLASDGTVQGLSIALRWNEASVEPVAVARGELLDRQDGFPALLSPRPGTVDVAGFGSTLSGEGEVARITFRAKGAVDPGIGIAALEARDSRNRAVTLVEEAVGGGHRPRLETRMRPATPNPFRSGTRLDFALARDGRVQIQVFGLDGRLVRTLLSESLPQGDHAVSWDGRDDRGRRLAAGTYMVRMKTREGTVVRRLTMIE